MATSPDLTGLVLDGRYRLVRVMGEGGMGRVYEGEHLGLGGKIAVKLLAPRYAQDSKFRERFRREARSTSRIRHPNVVQILDFGATDDGAVYFAMEFLEGRDLQSVLTQSGRLGFPRVAHLLGQAADALSVAHRSGIVHRDIKPANLFVLEGEGVHDFIKVLDFGIAKILASPEHESVVGNKLTGTGEIFGTVTYMAPEQAYGSSDDPRVDIYSLGVVAYEALTGRVPFSGGSAFEILTRHVYEAPIPPRQLVPSIPAQAEALVLRAMAKQPADRFATMAEFAAALRTWTEAERGSRAPPPPAPAVLAAPPIAAPPAPAPAPGVPVPLDDPGSGHNYGGSWPRPAPGPLAADAYVGASVPASENSITDPARALLPPSSSNSTGPLRSPIAASVVEPTGPGSSFVTRPRSQPLVWFLGVVVVLAVGTLSALGVIRAMGSDADKPVTAARDTTKAPAAEAPAAKAPAATTPVAEAPATTVPDAEPASPPSSPSPTPAPAAVPPSDPLPPSVEADTELIITDDHTDETEPSDDHGSKPKRAPSSRPATDAQIKQRLQKKLKRACKKKGSGTLTTIELLVNSEGKVLRRRVDSTSAGLTACIEGALQGAKFPAGDLRTVTIPIIIGSKIVDCNNPFMTSNPKCKG